MRDRDINGRSALNRGRKNGNAKLVEADVHDIRRRLKAGEPRISIARAYNVSRQAIYNIEIGADWGWLPEEP
jgi:DNA invertase Pin-like site-specific DNA recombinase